MIPTTSGPGSTGLREWIKGIGAIVVGVSPIVGGVAIKGPAAKIMQKLGLKSSVVTVAQHYRGLIDGFVIDDIDADDGQEIFASGIAVRNAQTVMGDFESRIGLANCCLALVDELVRKKA